MHYPYHVLYTTEMVNKCSMQYNDNGPSHLIGYLATMMVESIDFGRDATQLTTNIVSYFKVQGNELSYT